MEGGARMDGMNPAEVPFEQMPFPNTLSGDLYEYTSYRSRMNAIKYFWSLVKAGRIDVITRQWTLGRMLYRAVSFRPDEYTSKYYLLLSTGCLSDCSYCSEKYVFSTHTSRPEDQILDEFLTGLEKGYSLFTLEAFDTGTYGFDIGTDIISLLTRLHGHSRPDTRIELLNLNPQYLIRFFPSLKDLAGRGKIKLVQVPVQSGSNRVLEIMNRPYDIMKFRECISALNAENPNILLDTHFIVGHPGERDSDFQESLSVIMDLKFDKITGFTYEPKENTLAARMPDQVPAEEKDRRFRQLWNTALKAHLMRAATA